MAVDSARRTPSVPPMWKASVYSAAASLVVAVNLQNMIYISFVEIMVSALV